MMFRWADSLRDHGNVAVISCFSNTFTAILRNDQQIAFLDEANLKVN